MHCSAGVYISTLANAQFAVTHRYLYRCVMTANCALASKFWFWFAASCIE